MHIHAVHMSILNTYWYTQSRAQQQSQMHIYLICYLVVICYYHHMCMSYWIILYCAMLLSCCNLLLYHQIFNSVVIPMSHCPFFGLHNGQFFGSTNTTWSHCNGHCHCLLITLLAYCPSACGIHGSPSFPPHISLTLLFFTLCVWSLTGLENLWGRRGKGWAVFDDQFTKKCCNIFITIVLYFVKLCNKAQFSVCWVVVAFKF